MPANANVLNKSNAYFSVDSEGKLIFTDKGIAEFRSYFGKAGVDIRNIKTYDDYLAVRNAASPFFIDRLMERLNKGNPCLERQALKAIVLGESEKLRRIERLLDAQRKGISSV